MLLTGLIDSAAADSRTAAHLLGPEHPLARASEALSAAVTQCAALALPAICGAVAAALELSWARPLLVATAITAAVVVVRLAILLQARNSCVLDLLVSGDTDVPLNAVELMRRELTDLRKRTRLAKTLDDIRLGAESGARNRNPLTSRPAILAASDELRGRRRDASPAAGLSARRRAGAHPSHRRWLAALRLGRSRPSGGAAPDPVPPRRRATGRGPLAADARR